MVLGVRVVHILRRDVRKHERSYWYANNLFLDLGAHYKNMLGLCKSVKWSI